MVIETPEQYWKAVEDNRDDLLNIIAGYHPFYNRPQFMKITAPLAERARAGVEASIAREEQEDPQRRFEGYLKNKDSKIINLFNEAWFGVPESTDCWSIPGFGLLCDLCSEGWVLEDGRSDEGCED